MLKSKYPTLTLLQSSSRNTAEVCYGNEVLSWDTSAFLKTAYNKDRFLLFEQLNRFLATLPDEDQAKVFDAYKRLHADLECNKSAENRIRSMRPIVADLYSVFTPEQINHWTRSFSNVTIPRSLAESYIEQDSAPNIVIDNFDEEDEDSNDSANPEDADGEMDGEETQGKKRPRPPRQTTQASTREKTYLRSDYIELVGLAILLRLAVPFFGEFLLQTDSETGTQFKELITGRLLERSKIEEFPAYEKLRAYTREIVQSDILNISSILDTLSSEDHPTWGLYLAIVRRLSIGDIRGTGTDSENYNNHIVSSIHSYIKDRAVTHETNFSITRVRQKTNGSAAGDDENKLTVQENIKKSELISPSEEEEIQYFFEMTDKIVECICPTLPRDLLEASLESVRPLERERIHKPQERIVAAMIGPYLPPESLKIPEKLKVIGLIGICQAVLWYRGMKEMACIVSATELPRRNSMTIGGTGTRAHIPRAMSDELVKLFPHTRRSGRQNSDAKRDTLAHDVIRSSVSILFERDWKLNIPTAWRRSIPREIEGSRAGELRIPSDIRAHFGRFVIRVARNPLPFHDDAFIDEIG